MIIEVKNDNIIAITEGNYTVNLFTKGEITAANIDEAINRLQAFREYSMKVKAAQQEIEDAIAPKPKTRRRRKTKEAEARTRDVAEIPADHETEVSAIPDPSVVSWPADSSDDIFEPVVMNV